MQSPWPAIKRGSNMNALRVGGGGGQAEARQRAAQHNKTGSSASAMHRAHLNKHLDNQQSQVRRARVRTGRRLRACGKSLGLVVDENCKTGCFAPSTVWFTHGFCCLHKTLVLVQSGGRGLGLRALLSAQRKEKGSVTCLMDVQCIS